MVRKNKKFSKFIARHKVWLILLIMIIAGLWLWHDHRSKPSTPSSSPTTGASSSDDSTASSTKSQVPASSSANQGGAVDKKGQGVEKPSGSDAATSNSTNITLYSPTATATLHPGDTIIGAAKVEKVEYRLVDDQVGVLAQGDLSVVGGKFSGTISFSHHSNIGKLDIFSFDKNGAEINSISVNLKLGS